MIRIRSDRLAASASPIYEFPDGWPHDVFYVDSDGKNIMKWGGQRRVCVPEFEIDGCGPDEKYVVASTPEAAIRMNHVKVLKFLAEFCSAVGFPNSVATVAIRNDSAYAVDILPLRDKNAWVGSTILCLMLTHDANPSESICQYDWIPETIEDPEALAKDMSDKLIVMETMET